MDHERKLIEDINKLTESLLVVAGGRPFLQALSLELKDSPDLSNVMLQALSRPSSSKSGDLDLAHQPERSDFLRVLDPWN